MPGTTRLQFTIDIAAPVPQVFQTMLDPDGYRHWTTPFAEGSYYEGHWQPGQRIRFLSPSGHGMVSEIAEHRVNAFTSIRHLGYVADGVEDTESDAIRAWAPAYENYSFTATAAGTHLVVDQDATDAFAQYVTEAWPKALQRLKALCESGSAG